MENKQNKKLIVRLTESQLAMIVEESKRKKNNKSTLMREVIDDHFSSETIMAKYRVKKTKKPMKEPMNTDIIKSMDKIPVTKNTVSFEVDAPKKLNYHESDISLIDLADLVCLNPVDITECEKLITKVFLDTLHVDLYSKEVIDITTTPHELTCFFLTAIRRMPQQFINDFNPTSLQK
jgi:hypothetical protein